MDGPTHTEFSRADWTRLRSAVPMTLSEDDLARLRGANEPISLAEVADVYLPLTRLINLHVGAARGLARVTDDFVGRPARRRPYVVAIAGSVAVGKSTAARVLRALLSRWPDHPRVDLVATDGFLYTTATLQARGLMRRKGFPESYDVRRMIDFLAAIKARGTARMPVYSHHAYDIVPGEEQAVEHPDILIFEGLNVLQIGQMADGARSAYTASDFFDLSLYIDAEPDDIAHWYEERFLLLKRTAFQQPTSYFHHLAGATEAEARVVARELWQDVNAVNLRENIRPSRSRADVVIHKRADHMVDRLWLKRL